MKNNLRNLGKLKRLFFGKPALLLVVAALFFGLVILYPGQENINLLKSKFAVPSSITGNEAEQVTEPVSDVLGRDYYQQPQIYLSGGEQGYTAGGMIALASTDEPAVEIGGYQISGDAEISVYEATQSDLLDYLTHDKDGKQTKKNVDSSKMPFVATVKHSLNTSAYSGAKVPLPLKETGIWYLKVKVGQVSADAYVLRSNTGVLSKEGDNELIYWGQDFRTKRSITDGTVKLLDLLDSPKELNMVSFNAEGIARGNISANADIALINRNSDIAVVPLNLKYLNGYSSSYKQFREKMRLTRYFIFTDRPLYKPGDTVKFKTVLRDDDDARLTVPSGEAIVKVYNDYPAEDNKPLFEKSYPVSADGTISGEYKLPEDQSGVGYYYLYVEVPSSGTGERYFGYYDEYSTNSVSFNVQYYRKPEFSIDVKASNETAVAGDKASFTISGSYFSGQPMIGQKVKYTVYASDFYEYQYLNDREIYAGIVDDDYRYGYLYSDKKVMEGIATLNNNGEVQLDLDTKMNFNAGKSQVFSIEATIDDGSFDPAFARKNMLVFAGDYGIFRTDYNYGTKTNTPLSLPVVLKSDKANINVGNVDLVAKIVRTHWVSYQEVDRKYPSYREEKENLPDLSVKTDAQGEATFTFTPTKVGSYEITVSGKDTRGNDISKIFYSYVSDTEEGYYNEGGHVELTIGTDKQKYEPTDTVKFNIFSQIPDRDIFLTLERGRVNRFQIVRMQGKNASVDVPLVNTDIPNIYAEVSSFSNSILNSNQTNIEVSSDSKKILVSATPNSKTYGPGETVNVNIETKDTAGNPVSADVALWSVDKAIFELEENNLGDIFKTFWFERYNSTQQANSLEGILVNQSEGGGGCFAPDTQVLMADGTSKNIQDIKEGEYVMTRSENDASLIKGKVLSTHAVEVAGYMILNGNLKVTAEHILRVNNNWKDAGSVQIGDEFTGKNGEVIKVNSVEWQTGKLTVHNLEIEKTHTYFASGIWVHNQKGSPRMVFEDTAYWNPSIRTGTDGRAQVNFKLPDNLTTWVVAAVASTPDTRVGQTTNEITVTKDVIVRPLLPNIMRTGDEIILSAIVQNFTEQDQTFDVNLKFDSGAVDNPMQSDVVVKSNGMKQFFWKVVPDKENPSSKLEFSAIVKGNDDLADILTREVPVRPFGFVEKTAISAEGAKEFAVSLAVDANKEKSFVTLSISPTIVGSLPSAMKYLVDYAYGCVEQTTSRFVPAVIVATNQGMFTDILKDKDVDDIVEKGVSRLGTLQQGDGGWAWWSTGKSDPYLTAYVVEYLTLARDSGFKVDEAILNRTKYYLGQTSYYDSNGNQQSYSNEDMIAKSYALSILGESNSSPAFNWDNLSPDILSMVVMLNFRNGNTNPDLNGLNKLISMAQTQGDSVFWAAGNKRNFGSNDASTAMAIRAILFAGGDRDLAAKGARYLTRSRKFDYWSNTYATAQVIRALVELSKTGQELNPNYSYQVLLDGKQIAQGAVNNSKQVIKDIVVPLQNINDSSKLSVTKNGEGQIYSTLVTSQFHTDRNAKAVSNGLSIKREYENEKGPEYSLGVGDTAIVKLTISGLNSEENYGVINDELPSGMVPINENFRNEQYGSDPDLYYYSYDISDREITENGMILSLYNVPSGQRTYTYKARVINEGRFIVPPATVSLMYAPEINGRTETQTVTVAKESVFTPSNKVKDILAKNSNKLLIGIIILVIILASGLFIAWRKEIKAAHILEKIKNIFKRGKSGPPPVSGNTTPPTAAK